MTTLSFAALAALLASSHLASAQERSEGEPEERSRSTASFARLPGTRPDVTIFTPLELPMPREARALRIARRVQDDPAESATLDELARSAGGSRRTLERLFHAETGMSFGRWRQQARLLHAMRLLAGGAPVTTVALDVGYESTSAFIAAFSRALGTTPGRYYRAGGGEENGPDGGAQIGTQASRS